MVLRLLGTAVTDANGLAVLPDGYTGTGAGEVDIIAETTIDDSIIQSETYEVLDCQYIDNCTSDDHANWNSTGGFTWNDGKCTVTKSTSWFGRIATSIVGDFEATFKASMTGYVRLAMYNANNPSQQRAWNMNSENEQYYKIRRVNGVWTAQTSTDNTTWTNLEERSDDTDLTTEDVYFGFVIATSTERSITYTDLKVYPI